LCGHLGTLLVAMATEGRAYPAHDEPDDWFGEVRARGEALLAYDIDDPVATRSAQDALHWVADNLPQLWD
jgi:hypothetical protein